MAQGRSTKVISMIKWIRTSRLSIKNSLALQEDELTLILIIVMIWWTGLAPWEFEFPFPGSLISTFRAGGRADPDRRGAGLHISHCSLTHINISSKDIFFFIV